MSEYNYLEHYLHINDTTQPDKLTQTYTYSIMRKDTNLSSNHIINSKESTLQP